MENISSSSTLFIKYVIPTTWLVFFGTITLYILLLDKEATADIFIMLSPFSTKLIILGFFLSGLLFLWVFLMRIKRVELDDEFIYVTNYMKIYKYPYSNIKEVKGSRFLFFRPTKIYFNEPGSFGSTITFLANKNYSKFLSENPQIEKKMYNT